MVSRISDNPATRERWVLVLASVASLMVALDALVVSTALSTIRAQLHASIDQLEWTVNAYGLSFAVLLITGSALGDRFGRRRLFAGGLGLFAISSAACALAPNIGLLIAARALQGTGAALIAPLSLSLLTATIPGPRLGKALGVYGGLTGLAVLGGPVLGGAVTEGLAWQWIFWLNVPIGLAAVPLVLTRMPESHGPRVALDTPGLALITAAAFGIVWGLMRGNRIGWGATETVAALAGGALLSLTFVIVERRRRAPMLPMRLFARRAFAAGNATLLLLTGSLFGAVFFLAQFQQVVLGAGPLGAGVRLLPWTGMLFVVAPLAGSVVGRTGERPLVAGGLLLQAIGMAWLALIVRVGMPYPEMVAPMVLSGVGVSMVIPSAQNAVMGSVAPAHLGAASGTSSMMRQLGGVFGVAIVAAVFTGAGSYASPHAFASGLAPALATSAGFALAGAIVGLSLPSRPRVAQPAEPVTESAPAAQETVAA